MKHTLTTLLTLGLCVSACDGEDRPSNAGQEAGVTAGISAGVTAGTEAGVTSGTEAGVTAGTEAGVTAGTEAGVIAGTEAGTEPPPMPDELPLEVEAPLQGAATFDEALTEGQVRVGWVDEPEEALKGRNAMCRVGCLRLENHLVRFCIQGERNFSQFSNVGGNIIDAVRVSHPEADALSELFISPDLGEIELEAIEVVRDGSEVEGGPAVIQVRGRAKGSRIITGYLPQLTPRPYPMITEYRLWPNRSEVEVYTWVGGADAEGNPLGLGLRLADFVSWADDATLYFPLQRGESPQAANAFYGAHAPHVSYRWRSLDKPTLSGLTLPQLPFLPIIAGQANGPAGAVALFKRAFEVGEGSISSAPHNISLDAVDPEGGLETPRRSVELRVELEPLTAESTLELDEQGEPLDPTSPLHRDLLLTQRSVEVWTARAEGETGPMTLMAQARLSAEGVAPLIKLPAGVYELRLPTWAGPSATRFEVLEADLPEAEGAAPLIARAPLARPALVTLEASVEGWPAEELVGVKLLLTPEGDVGARERRHLPCLGRCSWAVAPGAWRAEVTRGWHFSASSEPLALSAGVAVNLTPTLTEELPFEGWSGGEFHQHSGPSLDSEVSPRQRVLSNIAEGVGFMVPSDHDVLSDYPALVERLGWGRYVAAPITGVEISPLSGHLGAYGLPYDVDHPTAAGGAVPTSVEESPGVWRRRWVGEIVAEARERGAEVIQVNHPRDSTGYFDEVGYSAGQDISELTSPHWTPDFDTIEIYNGSNDFCAVMRDWVGFLTQGKRVVGVGNSDSHDLSRPVGYPRNYLPTQAEHPTGITRAELVEALRGGRVSVGGGAYLDLPEGPLLGDTLTGATHSLRLRARTPSFSRLTRLVALFNGREVWSRELSAEVSEVVDFDEQVELSFEEDGALIFFAEGPTLERVNPGSPTFAFTNPLWIDANSDGELTLTPRVPPSFATGFCAAGEAN